MLTFSIFICLFGVIRSIRKFFTNMETSPLPVKGCKFWPCHPYCQCTIIILSSEELVLLKHNSFVPLSVAFEEQQKPHEPQHLLCFGRDIITSQGYLTLTVLIFRSKKRGSEYRDLWKLGSDCWSFYIKFLFPVELCSYI